MEKILGSPLKYLPGLGPRRERLLREEARLTTYGDLLSYFPYKYIDRSRTYKIREITTEMPYVQIEGRILSFETFQMGIGRERVVAHFTDGEDVMDLTWFGGGRYIKKEYEPGTTYIVFGKPTIYNNRINIVQPEIDNADENIWQGFALRPYYRLTEKMKQAGINQRTMMRYVNNLLERISVKSQTPEPISETIPDGIRKRRRLMGLWESYKNIHFPQSTTDLEKARIRLKFEELFFVQLNILRYARDQRRKFRGYPMGKVGDLFNDMYFNRLTFQLTGAQKRVIKEIWNDMKSGKQMNRLLQGDVGSGKTLVALLTMLLAMDNGYQTCLMAPTEILAEQHAANIRKMLGDMNVRVELLTGSVKGKERQRIMDSLADGSANMLIGTHAVIEENVKMSRLGYVVIDEQHRFGVEQRAKLWSKSDNPPHVLVMTATPIPRTLAMTLYGDLDVSVIDEMPPGRKPIETQHITDNRLSSLYESIRRQLRQGSQAYIVFPLIEESEKSDLKSLEEGFETLKEVFAEFKLSKVHGKMNSKEKEEGMRLFQEGKTHILVATTVIEVGVDVPNASIMVILDSQRFGLSQLHQLRGRVGRGTAQSYCILVTPYKITDISKKRIDIMCETNDGFRIAEADLQIRGPGDLEGTQQSGMAFDLKIANIARDGFLVQMARDEAKIVVDNDPDCSKPEYEILWKHIDELRSDSTNWSAIS